METEARMLRSSSTRAIVGMSNTPSLGGAERKPAQLARTTPVQPVCAQNVAGTLTDSSARSQFINRGRKLGSPINGRVPGANSEIANRFSELACLFYSLLATSL